jgi:hypothetical protein
VVDLLARYDMVPRYKNSQDYVAYVDEVIAQERAALERIGLLKKDKD